MFLFSLLQISNFHRGMIFFLNENLKCTCSIYLLWPKRKICSVLLQLLSYLQHSFSFPVSLVKKKKKKRLTFNPLCIFSKAESNISNNLVFRSHLCNSLLTAVLCCCVSSVYGLYLNQYGMLVFSCGRVGQETTWKERGA